MVVGYCLGVELSGRIVVGRGVDVVSLYNCLCLGSGRIRSVDLLFSMLVCSL